MDRRDTKQIDEAADLVEKTRKDLEKIANGHGMGGVETAERDRLRAARDAAGVLEDRLRDASRRYGTGSRQGPVPELPSAPSSDDGTVELGTGPLW